jgi:hypothetical protein
MVPLLAKGEQAPADRATMTHADATTSLTPFGLTCATLVQSKERIQKPASDVDSR